LGQAGLRDRAGPKVKLCQGKEFRGQGHTSRFGLRFGPVGLRHVKRQRTGGKGEGASADFRNLGRKHLWAEKGKKKENSFLFSESIFVDSKII
jgi:hypothetical protein